VTGDDGSRVHVPNENESPQNGKLPSGVTFSPGITEDRPGIKEDRSTVSSMNKDGKFLSQESGSQGHVSHILMCDQSWQILSTNRTVMERTW
jgi:hypothetical protein